jgi:ankyrin repeat protein
MLHINNTNKYCVTALQGDRTKGKLKIFRYLKEIGANIIISKAKYNTPLHYAAESGSMNFIKSLLDKRMSVNLTNKNISTQLHVSAQSGNSEATKTLVGRGGAINSTNKYGVNLLMLFAEHGKLEIFCFLTEIGADSNICNTNNNKTAIYLAAASGSVDIIRLLLDK